MADSLGGGWIDNFCLKINGTGCSWSRIVSQQAEAV